MGGQAIEGRYDLFQNFSCTAQKERWHGRGSYQPPWPPQSAAKSTMVISGFASTADQKGLAYLQPPTAACGGARCRYLAPPLVHLEVGSKALMPVPGNRCSEDFVPDQFTNDCRLHIRTIVKDRTREVPVLIAENLPRGAGVACDLDRLVKDIARRNRLPPTTALSSPATPFLPRPTRRASTGISSTRESPHSLIFRVLQRPPTRRPSKRDDAFVSASHTSDARVLEGGRQHCPSPFRTRLEHSGRLRRYPQPVTSADAGPRPWLGANTRSPRKQAQQTAENELTPRNTRETSYQARRYAAFFIGMRNPAFDQGFALINYHLILPAEPCTSNLLRPN